MSSPGGTFVGGARPGGWEDAGGFPDEIGRVVSDREYDSCSEIVREGAGRGYDPQSGGLEHESDPQSELLS